MSDELLLRIKRTFLTNREAAEAFGITPQHLSRLKQGSQVLTIRRGERIRAVLDEREPVNDWAVRKLQELLVEARDRGII